MEAFSFQPAILRLKLLTGYFYVVLKIKSIMDKSGSGILSNQ
jgi:hypothetical protein